MKKAQHPDPDETTLIAVMGALSDPVRVGLVRVLADGRERGWGELRAPVAKSTLSHHLRVLRDAGITRTRQEGTRCFVRLRRPDLEARFPGLLNAILSAARNDDVGGQVSLADDGPQPDPTRGSLSVGQTAFYAVRELRITAGETMLINGASGGVGTVAVQLAAIVVPFDGHAPFDAIIVAQVCVFVPVQGTGAPTRSSRSLRRRAATWRSGSKTGHRTAPACPKTSRDGSRLVRNHLRHRGVVGEIRRAPRTRISSICVCLLSAAGRAAGRPAGRGRGRGCGGSGRAAPHHMSLCAPPM